MDFEAPFAQPLAEASSAKDASVEAGGSGGFDGAADGSSKSDAGLSGAGGDAHAEEAANSPEASPEVGGAEDASDAADAVDGDGQPEAALLNCSQVCSQFCEDYALDSLCEACLAITCSQARDHYHSDPGMDALQSCIAGCNGNSVCESGCCKSHLSACAALNTLTACACGYPNASCTAHCALACQGAAIDTDCAGCIQTSPCGVAYYDFATEVNTKNFSACCNACNWQPSCVQQCCTQYPAACEARATLIDCVCN